MNGAVASTLPRQFADVACAVGVDQMLVREGVAESRHLDPGHGDKDDVALLVADLELGTVKRRAGLPTEEGTDFAVGVFGTGGSIALEVAADAEAPMFEAYLGRLEIVGTYLEARPLVG